MASPILNRSFPSLGAGFGDRARPIWKQAKSWVATAWAVSRERHRLADLDDRMLRDIGVGRDQANRESNRDLFDLPRNRGPRY